jgi:hopene-associated glycosyltransferase HpnB
MILLLGILTLGVWLYLVLARGGFWRNGESDAGQPPAPRRWPRVVAVVPARDEAEGIGATVRSLLGQNYAGTFTLVLVDDNSTDGTAAIARAAAQETGRANQLVIVTGSALPAGWTGKMWAVNQGVAAALELARPVDHLLLTDADITHAPDTLAWLVAQAESRKLVLTSLMAKLRCEALAERAHVPAFIYFFQMLYPFPWVNAPKSATAAAAGGCMLVRADALAAAGGIAAIRGALIDDCALARVMKRQGPIWLGVTNRVRSIRPYPRLDDFRRMVARSAYAQLNYSPLLLAGTTLGMALTFLAAPFLMVFGDGFARAAGAVTWALMALSFQPMLRFYRVSPLWGLALPAVALAYMVYTLDSAYRYVRGQGGRWKGRVQANASGRNASEANISGS